MPSVPAFVADFAETRFGTPARVSEIETIAPALRRVRFRSDELAKRHRDGKFGAGVWTVECRVARKEMRHYTACTWDFASGSFDVLFFLHGDGPGRSFAEDLRVGDDVRLLGPGSRTNVEGAHHVVIGDETSLGNARAVVESAPKDSHVNGVIACSATTESFVHAVGLSLEPLVGGTQGRLTERVIAWLGQTQLQPDAVYYLTGNRDLVTAVGKHLLHGMGVGRRSIHLRAHWVAGKRGL